MYCVCPETAADQSVIWPFDEDIATMDGRSVHALHTFRYNYFFCKGTQYVPVLPTDVLPKPRTLQSYDRDITTETPRPPHGDMMQLLQETPLKVTF